MVEYKLKDGEVLKDGHTMFFEDVVRDLNRLAWLEEERKRCFIVPMDNRNGVPRVTNEMKAIHIGEYGMDVDRGCMCEDADEDNECEICDGDGYYTQQVAIPWTSCKDIYKAMVKTAAIMECTDE